MSKKRFQGGGNGPSQRQLRVGEQVRRAFSDLLTRGDIHDPDLNRLSLTVGEVRMSPDLKIATAWVLPLGGGEKDEAIARLAANKSEIRRQLAKELPLKFAPDLRFRIDETFDAMDRARELFSDAQVQRDIAAPDRGDE